MSDREGHGHKAVLYKSHFPATKAFLLERHHCIHRLINHVYTKETLSLSYHCPTTVTIPGCSHGSGVTYSTMHWGWGMVQVGGPGRVAGLYPMHLPRGGVGWSGLVYDLLGPEPTQPPCKETDSTELTPSRSLRMREVTNYCQQSLIRYPYINYFLHIFKDNLIYGY